MLIGTASVTRDLRDEIHYYIKKCSRHVFDIRGKNGMKQGAQQAVQEVEKRTSNGIREKENVRVDFFLRLRKANRVSE